MQSKLPQGKSKIWSLTEASKLEKEYKGILPKIGAVYVKTFKRIHERWSQVKSITEKEEQNVQR